MDTASHPKTDPQASDTSSAKLKVSAIGKGLAQGKEYVTEQVVEHPTSSIALSFVIGAGIGVVVGASLFDQRRRHRSQTNEFLSRMSRAVSKAVTDSLPDQLRRS